MVPAEISGGQRKKILIVEDESLTAMALSSYLEHMGYTVLELAATGEDAVLRAERENPDIIFMDIRLAGKMDGIEAARIITSGRRIPIVILTGYTSRFVAERSSGFTPAGYLIKPINFNDINDILAAIG